MSNVNEILSERQKTHGDFSFHSRVTQDIKKWFLDLDGKFSESQKESLDMIAHKIGRIVAGNPNHIDHWDDIAGYATLVANELRHKDNSSSSFNRLMELIDTFERDDHK